MKKWICTLLALALTAACAFPVLAEDDPAVVTVNGDVIAQSELDAMIDSVSARMSQYGIDGTDESVLEVIRQSALQQLVDDRLLTQDMTAQGCYDMTGEEEAAIAASAQETLDSLRQQAESYFTSYLDGQEDVGITASDQQRLHAGIYGKPLPQCAGLPEIRTVAYGGRVGGDPGGRPGRI